MHVHDQDLELLENNLEISCKEILNDLQPGLTDAYMDQLLTDSMVNFELIKSIYRWRNGFSSIKPHGNKYSFHPMGSFIPLEDAVVLQQKMEKDGYWDYRFFPIMTNYDGEYLLLDIEEKSPTYGFLYIESFSLLISPPQTIYDSFHTFIKALTQCYASRAYIYRRRTHELEVNVKDEKIFSQFFNPRSNYWND